MEMSFGYEVVEISEHKNVEIETLYKKLSDVENTNNILRKDLEKIKSEHKELSELKKINSERLNCVKKYILKTVITCILLGFLTPFLIGHGYLTEMIFTNIPLQTYQNWQIFTMKLSLASVWFRFLIDIGIYIFK